MLLTSLTVLLDVAAALQPDALWPWFDDPIRPAHLGDINFLHTTDTHGWYLGHLNQRQYSSDWGDYLSFQYHMKEQAHANGDDLLIVDTGDRHDGNGLSDLTEPHGELSDLVFETADYDLVTVGNHELYEAAVSEYEYKYMIKHYGDRFISTNVEFLDDDGWWRVFGSDTYRYFKTEVNGYNVLAFSFMFDFKGGNDRVRVTPISTLVIKGWFSNMFAYFRKKPVDIIVIFGHMPVDRNWEEAMLLHEFIRQFFPDTVIQYFGGHSHIRDFAVYDELSTGLQSGRYCETVGFLSLSNITGEPKLQRQYIDFNLHSFMNHTNKTTLPEFHTKKGLKVSRKIEDMAAKLGLQDTYGVVPHSYYIEAADYYGHDPKSLLRFLENDILPQLEPKQCGDADSFYNGTDDSNRFIIINTGSIRYDLYKGPFTRNALFTVSPFSNKWKVIPNVPNEVSKRLKGILNAGSIIANADAQSFNSLPDLLSPYQEAMNQRVSSVRSFPASDGQAPLGELGEKKGLHYGYVTRDDLGYGGDDTLHKAVPSYRVPNVIGSFTDKHTETTEVIFYDFIESHILWALRLACHKDEELYKSLAAGSVQYNDCAWEYNVGHLLKKYVKANWPGETQE